jgi:hypothetical protein
MMFYITFATNVSSPFKPIALDARNWREISNDFDATMSVMRMLWRRGSSADEYAAGGSDDLGRNRVKLARLRVSR